MGFGIVDGVGPCVLIFVSCRYYDVIAYMSVLVEFGVEMAVAMVQAKNDYPLVMASHRVFALSDVAAMVGIFARCIWFSPCLVVMLNTLFSDFRKNL